MTTPYQLEITETIPTYIVKDFDTFVTYVRENNPALVRKGHFLTRETLQKIKKLMGPDSTSQSNFRSLLTLFYHLSLKSRLFIKDSSLKLRQTEKITEYSSLTAPEKYFFLLETLWVDTDWGTLVGERSNQLIPTVRGLIGYFARKPGNIIPMKRLFHVGSVVRNIRDALVYLSFFGLLDITFEEDSRRIPRIHSVIVTELGKYFFPILSRERNITRWNIPYLRQTTEEYITSVGGRSELFFSPFQAYVKGTLAKTVPREVYRKGALVLRVSLRGGVSRTLLLSSEHTLEDFHDTIQDAFDFDSDHLYAFFIDGIPWSRNRIYAPGGEGPFADNVCMGELGLFPHQQFLYIFDFGDEWHFKVEVLEIRDDEGPSAPVITERKGKSPEQYPYYE